jgi:hypothetical protein
MKSCFFCGDPVNQDAPDLFQEVSEWVSGPKKHGAVLREYTGNVAHGECVEKLKAGQAPDQEPLF